MPPAEEIHQSLAGVWRMILGKADGVRMLDLSVDGFWNSFFAIVVGLPAMIAGWVTLAHEITQTPDRFSSRFDMMLRLAVVDIGTWVLPIVLLALAVRHVGLADRFVHYVVASNWSSAIFVWMMLPPALLRMIWPGMTGLASGLSLILFIATLVLSWRVTNAALAKGPAVATSLFAAMFALSLAILFSLQLLLGIVPPG
jgi:hypothetical protein